MSKVRAKKPKSLSSKDVARLMAQAAHDTKAADVKVLDLRKVSSFADYFVICSGTSDRQVQAISDRMRAALKKSHVHPLGIEGYQTGHWVLVDCGSVIGHVFYEEVRGFYGLEKLWGDAPRVKFKLK